MGGRTIVGLGVGFGLAVDPLYIAEISPAKYRGRLVTWSEIATNVGILLGFIMGFAYSGLDRSASPAAGRMLALLRPSGSVCARSFASVSRHARRCILVPSLSVAGGSAGA